MLPGMPFGRPLSAFRAGARPRSWWSRLGGASSSPFWAVHVAAAIVMAALPDTEGDDAIPTPALLALVLRSLEARRRVDGFELLRAT
jgi:uncharacterized membrane protein